MKTGLRLAGVEADQSYPALGNPGWGRFITLDKRAPPIPVPARDHAAFKLSLTKPPISRGLLQSRAAGLFRGERNVRRGIGIGRKRSLQVDFPHFLIYQAGYFSWGQHEPRLVGMTSADTCVRLLEDLVVQNSLHLHGGAGQSVQRRMATFALRRG